jgi:leucyl aminopeptidase (aminopeptidase T)
MNDMRSNQLQASRHIADLLAEAETERLARTLTDGDEARKRHRWAPSVADVNHVLTAVPGHAHARPAAHHAAHS